MSRPRLIHRVKCELSMYRLVVEGRKTFEARRNDRDYQEGDHIELHPVNAEGWPTTYAGSAMAVVREIGYVFTGGFGLDLPGDWVVFSLLPIPTPSGDNE